MKRIATLLAGLALTLVLLAPGSAFAQSSSSSQCQAYNPQLCTVSNQGGTSSSGTLPFTGIDVGLLAVGGGGLLAAGLVVRRLSRHMN